MRALTHRVAAWLHHRDQARLADARAQAGERGRNGGRVVRKIVVDGGAGGAADAFQASTYAAKSRQQAERRRWLQANRRRGSIHHEGVTREFWAMPWQGYNIWGATAGMIVSFAEHLLGEEGR